MRGERGRNSRVVNMSERDRENQDRNHRRVKWEGARKAIKSNPLLKAGIFSS